MKRIFFTLSILFLMFSCTAPESIFELNSTQSMLMTGKGPGQDGAINPYSGENSIGLVKNIGKNSFQIRVQNNGEIIEEIDIKPKEKKEIVLLKGYELYLDTEQKSKAIVRFKKYTK